MLRCMLSTFFADAKYIIRAKYVFQCVFYIVHMIVWTDNIEEGDEFSDFFYAEVGMVLHAVDVVDFSRRSSRLSSKRRR